MDITCVYEKDKVFKDTKGVSRHCMMALSRHIGILLVLRFWIPEGALCCACVVGLDVELDSLPDTFMGPAACGPGVRIHR